MDVRPGETTAPLTPGEVLEGKYRVGRALGGGAMGLVYEAYHLRLQKAVAVKVLRPEMAAVEEVRDRFEAEARAAAASGHPNIVSVTDLGQTPGGALYFVMDRLRGETLGERLERSGRLDVATTAAIMLEVLSGLEAAHALRLVHRDLKPDNIFLAKAPGGREIAKILDFGIAKALASVGKRAKGTRVGMTVGTPLYMAPEQAVADPDIDHRADLYAAGVIIYQMLAGRPPFEGADAVQVLAAVLTATPAPLESLCPAASPALIRLLQAAMHRDRNKRPGNAGEFAARLREATATGATPAPVVASSGAGLDDPRFAALESAVLVDLAGQPPPAAATFVPVDDRVPDEPPVEPPIAPRVLAPPPRAARVQATPDQDDLPLEPAGTPFPWRQIGRVGRWLVPIAVVTVAALYAAPVVSRALGQKAAAALPAARPTALVQFDVTPHGSRLFLDGAPLASNPVTLGQGEVHTVTGVADGYKMGNFKFLVDQAKTVRLKLERGRDGR
jgi:serine/threonine protein kinase